MDSRVEHVERVEWLMKDRSRKVCGWMVCGGIAAVAKWIDNG